MKERAPRPTRPTPTYTEMPTRRLCLATGGQLTRLLVADAAHAVADSWQQAALLTQQIFGFSNLLREIVEISPEAMASLEEQRHDAERRLTDINRELTRRRTVRIAERDRHSSR